MNLIKLEILWAGKEDPSLFNSPYCVWLIRWSSNDKKSGIRIEIFSSEAIEIRNGIGKKLNPDLSFADFFQDSLLFSGATIKEVIIGVFKENNSLYYYSRLIIASGGKEKKIPCSVTTAIALAARFDCPIYMPAEDYPKVSYLFKGSFDKLNKFKEVYLEESEVGNSNQLDISDEDRELKESTDKELKEMLTEALNKENYEKAGKIRNVLESRKNGNDSQDKI